MSQQLINHSPDLKRLQDEGYSIEVKGGYLLIHQIPYVNVSRQIQRGTLVTQLTLVNSNTTAPPGTHVIFFIGDQPCNKDGTVIAGITHGSNSQNLGFGIIVNRSFSNKPPEGYFNYYQQVTTYAGIISAPAKSLDKTVSEKTFDTIADTDATTTFHYVDTNSSRANINYLNAKFNNQKIAIIGLGGTGAYILDLVAKTPVREIHLFDGDDFLQHNAFRSPGAASIEQLNKKMNKVQYYADEYSNIHKHIVANHCYVTSSNMSMLNGMSYVFICIDNDTARKSIMQYLLKEKITFIDVGLGVNIVEDNLVGTLRVTTGSSHKNDHLKQRVSFEEDNNNEYVTNIQIADLNSLNAALAVLKWKKLSGFYQDLLDENHCTYSINVAQLLNEDTSA